ncbi:4-alpha-glucanotransferase [Flaviflexus equikiangi]|uniref:4-alpha-glucanotransferase n=1 Tax=Flaviflexus equikiangi TaxID=2758573 RepID=A0ABS2TEJ3_9ACTO|nr:4-alpha-glucanotransferase [Flaviflexus equikiangi]MBM9433074.1 4-alpha-glucanotransferase [Flaviflexus equikiangi]
MSVPPSRSTLTELAAAYRISTQFWGYDGIQRDISDDVLIKVLGSMGVDATTEDRASSAIANRELESWRTVLPLSVVHRQNKEGRVQVHVPAGEKVALLIQLEDGGQWPLSQVDDWTADRDIDGRPTGQASFLLPGDIPLGYHTMTAILEDGSMAECPFIMTPDRLDEPALETSRAWGVSAQLYSVRSAKSWGIGDFSDLADLAAVFGHEGADFFQINPLHAAEPVGNMSPSPYLPVSRRFINPIYIRPEAILETAYMTGPQRSLIDWGGEEQRASSLRNEYIDRDEVWTTKREALEVIFAVPRSFARQAAFAKYLEEEGEGLQNFALWCALCEKYPDGFPETIRTADSIYVDRERRDLRDRIEFWSWLQWVADEQLQRAQETAQASGMKIGICTDLAVGVHPLGADVWSNPEAFAQGVTVGAPADMYNQHGQDWSQPPWRPETLAATGYAPLRDMIRTVLRHAGMLRVDHIAGFFRLWWIPNGYRASEGTYVNYDHEAMIGILLLEAHRAGAILVGEDLGTVEPWVRDFLKARGIYGTSIFWFEKDNEGKPLRPEHYRREVLSSVNTHDLPPAAGYIAGEHVDLRERLGLLTQPVEQVRADAERELQETIDRLREYGLVDGEPTERELVEALHSYIAQTPSTFLSISLVDAVGERRAQNMPGTDQEYPNWRVPLADGTEDVVLVGDIPTHARVTSLLSTFRRALGADNRLL